MRNFKGSSLKRLNEELRDPKLAWRTGHTCAQCQPFDHGRR